MAHERGEMVCGFLLWQDMVLLVEKQQPAWQRFLLNGVGGGVELGETTETAMRREFREEARLDAGNWRLFACEEHRDEGCPTYAVTFYAARVPGDAPRPVVPERNDADEKMMWLVLDHALRDPLGYQLIGNLRWLLPLALDWRAPVAMVRVDGPDIRQRPTW